MAQSGASDRIAIDDQERDATWRIVEHSIAREISTFDLHLIYFVGIRGEIGFTRSHFISAVNREEL